MAKKRKLNSKNPRYITAMEDNKPKINKKVLMCNAPVRDASKAVVKGVTVPVYGVWYEND
tara:strand:+ start:22967 stop:23146 length:180 start_codon:yes stop_codon:yes gene_type:complete